MNRTSIATGEKSVPPGDRIESKDVSDFVSCDVASGIW
jgi:hypothetical protein